MIRRRRPALVALALSVFPACGGGGGASSAPSPPRLLGVGGSYVLTKTVGDDTCGSAATAFTFPATVTHSPGAFAFVLNDSFNDLAGTVNTDGTFSIPSRRTGTHEGGTVQSTFDMGRFTSAGFDLRARHDVDGSTGTPPYPSCHIVESWHGLKQGSPNVIP